MGPESALAAPHPRSPQESAPFGALKIVKRLPGAGGERVVWTSNS